jgi:hypothetical protein
MPRPKLTRPTTDLFERDGSVLDVNDLHRHGAFSRPLHFPFLQIGPAFLHEYFPFWMAALIGKLIILLIPILGLLYPMTRFLPRLYDWVMRSRILRMYGELRLLEDEMASARDTREMVVRLDRLAEQANHLRVPIAYASMLYSLRDHIDLVREGLKKH